MTIYFLILALFVILRAGVGNKKINGIHVFSVIAFIAFVVIYIIRDLSVGWDTLAYHRIFMSAPRERIFESYLEPGWILLIKGIYSISTSDRFYFLIISLIGMLPFFWLVNKISADKSESILIYYLLGNYFNLMNQQRCQIAVGICMISFYCLLKKKYIPTILWVILAFLIHESALVFFVFILFDFVMARYSKKIFYIVVAGVVAVMMFYDQIFGIVTRYYYTSYTTEAQLIKEASGGNLKEFFAFGVLFLVIMYVDSMNNRNSEIEQGIIQVETGDIDQERLKKLLVTAILFALSLQLISIRSTMIARFSNYFSVYFTILIPFVFSKSENKMIKRQYRAVVYIILLVFMIMYLRFSEGGLGRDGIIPYMLYQR